jgi:cytochrome bd-type quinol oxidase subunit 1
VGYTIRDARAELVDFFAVISKRYAILKFVHTVSAYYVLSAFFVMGVSAYHLLKKKNIEIGTISSLLSLLVFHNTDAEVKGLKTFTREERHPVLITPIAFILVYGV